MVNRSTTSDNVLLVLYCWLDIY